MTSKRKNKVHKAVIVFSEDQGQAEVADPPHFAGGLTLHMGVEFSF